MHVLTIRGGELVALVGPICDNDECAGCAGFAGLQGAQLADYAVVADRDDITPQDLQTAAAGFLQRTGWTEVDPALCAQLAAEMAEQAAEIASRYERGTRVRATFDRSGESWAFTAE